MDEEIIIRANIPSLLSAREVKAKTCEINGEWKLHEDAIQSFHATARNIEFVVILENGANCLHVSAKIRRDTAKLSNIKIKEF